MSHAPSGPTIETLLADRARFESWLAQLDHKAGDLPPHIVTRVRADYSGRLQRVLDELAARADDLRAEAAELAGRVTTLEAALTAKRDARAEDALRAVVGEFDEATWAERAAQHDAAIATLDAELQTRITERDRVQLLVSNASRGEVPPTAARDSAAAGVMAELPGSAATAPDSSAPGAGPTSTASGASAPVVPPVVPPPAVPPPPIAPPAPQPRSSAAVPRAEQLPMDVGGPPPMPAPAAPTAPATAPSLPDLLPTPSFDSPPKRSSQQTAFDEMAFLDTVVGSGRASDELPAAADPSGGVPAAAPEADAQRTLKCQECGWMNVPTEWYCEKCGGELSAF